MEVKVYKEFIGQKIKSIEIKREDKYYPIVGNIGDYSSEIIFTLENGKRYCFFHGQEVSENVYIEDISGDINKLLGKEIMKFEERSENKSSIGESETWTFYDIETLDQHIQIRWYGESNGYYSESVDFCEVDAEGNEIVKPIIKKEIIPEPIEFITYDEVMELDKPLLVSNKIGTFKTSIMTKNEIKGQFKNRKDIRYVRVSRYGEYPHPYDIENIINAQKPIFHKMSLEKLFESDLKYSQVVTFRKDNKTSPKRTSVENLRKYKNTIKETEKYVVLFNCPENYFQMKFNEYVNLKNQFN